MFFILNLLLPNDPTESIQPAAAPGTVTAWADLIGILPNIPWGMFKSPLTLLRVDIRGERPDPFMA
jgi:hypothetical protein